MKMVKKLFLPFFMVLMMVITLVPMVPKAAMAEPLFQLPFPCGQVWSGQTRTDHSPANAIDFNRTDDLGDTVVAAAGGTVSTVRDLGSTSYGKYVVIDHGGGWTTYYAHLNSWSVSVGQSISKGQKVGYVGSTGGSTGPHLHFEERLNGVTQKVDFNGVQALYWGTKNYTSQNTCSSPSGATGTINTSGADLNVRSGPSTTYSIVRQVSDGQQVTITCQVKGQSVTGTYGTTSWWDKLSGGGYVSDAYVYTGSDGQIAPTCP